jgi:hypothetical protein
MVAGGLLGAVFGTQALLADEADVPEAIGKKAATPEPRSEGFWPTERMIDYAVRRWCGQVSYEYDLDEEQAARLEEMMQRRWPRWMKEHRRELQPLINEFMENRLAPEPPSPEQVSKWADKALRLFSLGRDELHAAQAEFRQWLRPRQKMKFDADVTKINVGMEIFERKLRGWQEGRFARNELWDEPYWVRERERETAERRAAETPRAESGPSAAEGEPEPVPLDMWESYVAAFIKEYSLDDAQITSAWTIMGDLRARADRYRDRHSLEYARIQEQWEQSDEQTRKTLVARKEELDEPLAQLFDELKDRLSRLLTDAQRRAVEDEPEAGAEQAASSS